ncbi:MAG: hypothetical protein IT364_10525 [Candidatus Hydrogenedentes bacterium]|nr:hypothetical protein [Candidatus Hydrogenedentota bacterium]
MLSTLITCVGGLVVIMLLWLAVQVFVRRQTPEANPDCDLLRGVIHDCGGCGHSASCAMREDSPR